jgi:hypothetical protein
VKEIEAHKMRVVEGEITQRLKKAFSDYIAEEIARCARMEQAQKTRT